MLDPIAALLDNPDRMPTTEELVRAARMTEDTVDPIKLAEAAKGGEHMKTDNEAVILSLGKTDTLFYSKQPMMKSFFSLGLPSFFIAMSPTLSGSQ